MTGRDFPVTAALALVALALLCGAALAQEAPTRAEYVDRAERVCKGSKERTEPVLEGVGGEIKSGKLGLAGHALRKAARLFAAQRGLLAKIPKPPADKKLLSAWLTRIDAQNRLMDIAGRLMQEDRRSKVGGYFARYAHAGKLANDTVLGFGFDKCLFRLAKLPKP